MFRKLVTLTVLFTVLFMVVFGAGINSAQAAPSQQCSMFYTVQQGDTLYRIARTYNTTVTNLVAWNGLASPNRILVGQQLCVGMQIIVDDGGSATTYVVQRGDTLFRIARAFGIDWRVLAQVNGLAWPYRIYVGQVLNVPQVTTQ